VLVHALIAHSNRGGEKLLRKLELALLGAGVTVSRTDDDLVRYHGKMVIVDRRTLFVLAFNFTHLDIGRSRSFGLVTRRRVLVQDAAKLFDSDSTRQPYTPVAQGLIVSPANARARLTSLLQGARRQLLIYDPRIMDRAMIRLLQARAAAGVEVRILGRIARPGAGLRVRKLPEMRLHVRAILRDGRDLFIGSQSLRPLELDRRREIGVIVRSPRVTSQFKQVFETDWALTRGDEAAEPRVAREASEALAAAV
jgi:phosphatidylserine/phosphatidylglycerophosphate/cardiolipin synthase-like enzyme